MARYPAVLEVLLLFACVLVTSSSAAISDDTQFRARGASPKKTGILSRLGLGGEFWGENVVGRAYDDWTVSERSAGGKEALRNFTRAGSLAGYVDLASVDAIHIPLPINFIFIGFDGDGNQGFKLGEEELERWFTKLDNIVEHTRVPQLGEALTPFYKVKGSGENQHHLPFISYSHYNYSVHGIGLNSKVTAVFERAIKLLSRKDNGLDTSAEDPLWQVDVTGISHVFRSLVSYLQLGKAYNIFVLNPKRDPSHGSYGYRAGLSKSEIKLFQVDENKRKALLNSKEKVQDFLAALAALDEVKNAIYDKHPLVRFCWTTVADEKSVSWADKVNVALDSIEDTLRLKSDEEVMLWFARLLLNGNDIRLSSAIRAGLTENSGLQPECLVDTWVGDERWSFVDLSAGPFTWGPTVGGDGIRSELSLPSVDSSFSEILDAEAGAAALRDQFQDRWLDRFSLLNNNGRLTVEMLLAELDVYRMLADRHCNKRKSGTKFCGEFLGRLKDARDELVAIEGQDLTKDGIKGKNMEKLKAVDLLKSFDEGNIFGFRNNQRAMNFSVARDAFLAHLGSSLSSAMRHVVTPSTADGAFHYYENVYFQVYFITEEKLKHDGLLPVDTDGLKAALSGLIVPSQRAIFGFHTLPLSEDPALAMAVTSAKRATIVPMLLVNGTYKSADRVYLDSLILRHHIKRLHLEQEKVSNGRSSIDIPIFWFIRSSGDALLVDKHYQAKALPDMVIVVQSLDNSWESHLQCNGESILWDLRQPIKAAVAAVAEHMGGLLPSHVTFSQAHENAMQDWLWSVGSHPFSSTSAGWQALQFHNDAMARSYIVTALDESIDVVNSGVQLLAKERTDSGAFSAFRDHEHSLRYSYNQVVRTWKQLAGLHEELKYAEALKLLSLLDSSAQSFYSKANETIAAMHPVYCTQKNRLKIRKDLSAGLCIVLVLICLRLVLKPKVTKPKIN